MYSYEYPRPALTADIAVIDPRRREVLLIRRGNEPYKNHWALPGGFFDMSDPDIGYTAARELEEETGLKGLQLKEMFVASREGRDPRGRTVTVIHMGLVDKETVAPAGGDDAAEARWFPLGALPPLAFDHDEVIARLKTELAL